MILQTILAEYNIDDGPLSIDPFGSGLINNTWIVRSANKKFILQRINENVFRNPGDIAFNIESIGTYLRSKFPGYFFVSPVKTISNKEMVFVQDSGYFRLFPFVEGSHSIDVVNDPVQAYEAAKQFGLFTRLLSDFDATKLKATIPNFHDLSLRHRQFEQALKNGNPTRIKESRELIGKIHSNKDILEEFESIKQNPGFKIRVTHHDAKISNVLFDKHNKGICVIDLDTVMPGYFISDVGDMMRTYLSPVSEEETDLDKIVIREEYFKAIVDGYNEEMKDELSFFEKEHFLYAGKFMIYMQALRFLADHINDDVYYGARYEGHNFSRAANQLRLLECLVHQSGRLTPSDRVVKERR